VTLCLRNRAGVRALLACALAKIDKSKLDIRKPYTDIAGDDGTTSYSGRAYDETYLDVLKENPYDLPINATTAFLTPGFRTKNITLSRDVELEGRPAEMYEAFLHLLDDIHKGRVSAETVMDETMRLLILERNKRKAAIEELLKDILHTGDRLPLSVEDTVTLLHQHLECKNSSRLPVLIVAAAYRTAQDRIGERVLHLHPHNAADRQTGAAGDIEITLINDDNVATAYEMKMKVVTVGDINRAVEKVKRDKQSIQHYVFVTTDQIDKDVKEYAAGLYEQLGGTEIAILDCLGFISHFLHVFHRLRTEFLNTYQKLLLAEPDSAVSHTLKQAFLTLRKAAEGAN